jgi:integrase
MNAVQPIRDKEKIQEILRFLKEWNYKYYLMFLMGIRSGLRISDILKLKVKDIREVDGRIKTHLITKEKKTTKRKRIKLHSELKKALIDYTENKDDEAYLIPSNKKDKFKDRKPLSRQRAWEVMKIAADFVGLSEIGCHTLRKTFGYHYYQRTKDIALLMYLFNHSKPEITLRYIGITDDMMDKAFDSIDY